MISAPLCPTPPAIPNEGKQDFNPIVFALVPQKGCGLEGSDIKIQCHSFLSIYISSAYYGRIAAKQKKLCFETVGKILSSLFN